LRETNQTIDIASRNPKELLRLLKSSQKEEERNSSNAASIGDYLAAEHLGNDFNEWQALFVPKFIATDELLERNISVLTGLRGCGKTMLFKRLTSYFNIKLNGCADLAGSDSFYGFYINARDIAETFPWLPEDKIQSAREQIIHNFNLRWTLEILIWLREEISKNNVCDIRFLNDYFKESFSDYFTSEAVNSISYIILMIKKEINKSRLMSCYHSSGWPLTNYDYLDELVTVLNENVNFIEKKPFYFFLDDYSTPMVKASIQKVINPIIFRRSATIVFKISTESVESFLQVGLNNKTLEENNDYRLIDCGMLTLNKSTHDCKNILFSIINKRINRHPKLKDRELTAEKMLGKTVFNDEKRAEIIKNFDSAKIEEGNKKHIYQGWEVFCDMWTSDIREMINYFADMVNKEEKIEDSNFRISDKIQDDVYKEAGQHFIALLDSATNPSEDELQKDRKIAYAKHLRSIVESFGELALYELKNKMTKNEGRPRIKKARRIEIKSIDGELTEEALSYYKGLLRYGIFIRDYRGKSIQGKIVPRLVLRGRLIPCFRLVFSKRDNIAMSWDEFQQFLLQPREFIKAKMSKNEDQKELLFDSDNGETND
jgi:dephospho-CoA kinase